MRRALVATVMLLALAACSPRPASGPCTRGVAWIKVEDGVVVDSLPYRAPGYHRARFGSCVA